MISHNNYSNMINVICNESIEFIPQTVLFQLCQMLNKPGPCNWQSLQRIITEKHNFFTPDEIKELEKFSPNEGCFNFLKLLGQKQVAVGVLLDCLSSLPCLCSWKLLHKNLMENPTIPKALSNNKYTSLPLHSSLSVNERYINSNPISLPQNFHFADCNTHESVITQHPKQQSIKKGETFILKCLVKSSFQSISSFQWFRMYTPMVDETKHMVLVPEAKLSDEGFYRCRITFNGKVELSNWTYVSVGPEESKCVAADKIALLIANERYVNHKPLPAASRDIETLTEILQTELNFKTYSFVNLNFLEIHRTLQWLCSMAKSGCYCVFYFGGHGYENDGKCFMVPVDAPAIYSNADCINAHIELENIQRRCNPNLMLILLDICRKRNEREQERIPCSATSFNPNVVLAYATMESREAFEKRGQKHGVFVNSLRKHLSKEKRVNFMLTDVQDDVKSSCLQIAEVRTTLVEERCLTDPIEPRPEKVSSLIEEHIKWLKVHNMLDRISKLTQLGRNRAMIELTCRSILTNKIELSIYLREIDPRYYSYRLEVDLSSIEPQLQPEIIQGSNPLVVHLSNIQRLAILINKFRILIR